MPIQAEDITPFDFLTFFIEKKNYREENFFLNLRIKWRKFPTRSIYCMTFHVVRSAILPICTKERQGNLFCRGQLIYLKCKEEIICFPSINLLLLRGNIL